MRGADALCLTRQVVDPTEGSGGAVGQETPIVKHTLSLSCKLVHLTDSARCTVDEGAGVFFFLATTQGYLTRVATVVQMVEAIVVPATSTVVELVAFARDIVEEVGGVLLLAVTSIRLLGAELCRGRA